MLQTQEQRVDGPGLRRGAPKEARRQSFAARNALHTAAVTCAVVALPPPLEFEDDLSQLVIPIDKRIATSGSRRALNSFGQQAASERRCSGRSGTRNALAAATMRNHASERSRTRTHNALGGEQSGWFSCRCAEPNLARLTGRSPRWIERSGSRGHDHDGSLIPDCESSGSCLRS